MNSIARATFTQLGYKFRFYEFYLYTVNASRNWSRFPPTKALTAQVRDASFYGARLFNIDF